MLRIITLLMVAGATMGASALSNENQIPQAATVIADQADEARNMRRVTFDFRGATFYPGDRIHLRRELERVGYNTNRFNLRGVRLFAERGSRGRVSLHADRREQDSVRIQNAPTRRGLHVAELENYSRRNNGGAWQIHFDGRRNARTYVDRVVIDLKERRRPPRRDRWECTYRHRVNQRYFRGYARNQRQAKQNAQDACKRTKPRAPGLCEFMGCR